MLPARHHHCLVVLLPQNPSTCTCLIVNFSPVSLELVAAAFTWRPPGESFLMSSTMCASWTQSFADRPRSCRSAAAAAASHRRRAVDLDSRSNAEDFSSACAPLVAASAVSSILCPRSAFSCSCVISPLLWLRSIIPQNGDVVESQKLRALGIRNRIEAEIGPVVPAFLVLFFVSLVSFFSHQNLASRK
jgi:hypothetical protein